MYEQLKNRKSNTQLVTDNFLKYTQLKKCKNHMKYSYEGVYYEYRNIKHCNTVLWVLFVIKKIHTLSYENIFFSFLFYCQIHKTYLNKVKV